MELVDIVDENNELTGQVVERDVAHKENLWHRHVSCWIMNLEGKILLERRSPLKEKNPNKWAKIGGHVESNESIEEAIIREVEEEIGIKIPIDQVKVHDLFKSDNSKEHFFTYNFIFLVNYDISEYKLQEEEVVEAKYFDIEELEKSKINNDENFVFNKWSDDSFNDSIKLLKEFRDTIIKTKK